MPDGKQILGPLFEAKERECPMCRGRFVGARSVCGDPRCELAMRVRAEENRSLRPRDYVSGARKAFLVSDVPEPCTSCGAMTEDGARAGCAECVARSVMTT